MRPVLTPVEMAAADRRAIADGTPGLVLMDRAGRAVAWAARRVCGGVYGRRVVVVCGKGNNGGDGLVAAEALRGWGARVDVFRLEEGVDRDAFVRALERADVFVDAMFGTGLRGALDDDAAWIAGVVTAARPRPHRIAVDIPSGVDGTTGGVAGVAFAADETVTFAAVKSGLCFEPGREHAGVVHVVDIGIDVGEPQLGIVEGQDVAAWLPARDARAHKWSAGVMVVGGSGGMVGAPNLVSRAALRAGAGIVWCGLPGADAAARASGSEVITKALPATPEGALDEHAAVKVLEDLDRFRAIVVGPGLGTDDRTRAAVGRIVAEAPLPLVLDADGLNALRGDLAPLLTRARAIREPTVLTPHPGEYERLMRAAVGDDRAAAARRLASTCESIVLLKGPGTVVAAPDGRCAIELGGGPWLASAGTGDVLSGVIGALLARGLGAFEAAAAGAWLHSRAADLAGHTGLVAGDIVRAIPEARRTLER